MQQQYDVLIIGAGLSGIGMACHLARECPDLEVGIIERRTAIGGTWDLFRYPGIRSDSDMFSFGYDFRPWNGLKILADGTSIREYVTTTAREYGVDKKIRFGLKTVAADWSGAEQCWTVTALEEATGATHKLRARFVVSATGYYDYDGGYRPAFPDEARFAGTFVHPQKWPENLDYKGKRVVVIGSGATAVTLVPAMAEQAAHVTMLQRSPTYIFSIPNHDKISEVLRHVLPERWVNAFARWRNITLQRVIYKGSRRAPGLFRSLLLGLVRRKVGPNVDMAHFTPRYMPWDERLCAVPDADLFEAVKTGKATVVTDQVKGFTPGGILLQSGRELAADIVVTATGLKVQVFGGVEVRVDGKPVQVTEHMTYKGVLLQDVPNLAWIFGYTNASWTLKADIASRYVCRLLNHMRMMGAAVATARAPAGQKQADTILGALSSGYIQRAAHTLPRQGKSLPWRVLHDYRRDQKMLVGAPVADAALELEPQRAEARVMEAIAQAA